MPGDDPEDLDDEDDPDNGFDFPPYAPFDDDDRDFENGDLSMFARPGSALRRATPDNPREFPCPTCGRENALTPADVVLGYQCDHCAEIAEGRIIE